MTSAAYTSGGISNPVPVAVDGAGRMWVANSNGTVSALSNTGTAVSPSTGYSGTGSEPPASRSTSRAACESRAAQGAKSLKFSGDCSGRAACIGVSHRTRSKADGHNHRSHEHRAVAWPKRRSAQSTRLRLPLFQPLLDSLGHRHRYLGQRLGRELRQ
jgi:hypothetical protein